MSKERLEEIKKSIEFNMDWARGTHYAEVNEDDLNEYKWAVERVQELERQIELEYNDHKNFEAGLLRENKRYREVLGYVAELDCIDWNKEELAEMARKALESEANE